MPFGMHNAITDIDDVGHTPKQVTGAMARLKTASIALAIIALPGGLLLGLLLAYLHRRKVPNRMTAKGCAAAA